MCMIDDHYDMITNGFPDGNDDIGINYPGEFEEAFRILSEVNPLFNPLYYRIELCVVFQFK